jgi:nucleotide-binding universal stress UspA family protein
MSEIREILFPIDFSERSIAAVPHVRSWATRFSAEVAALHVVDPEHYFTRPDPDDPRMSEELATAYAERVRDLDYFCGRYLGDSHRIRKLVSAGPATDVIAAIAEREKADILMLPRNHQNLASRLLHDSLAAKILERCPTPVWTSEKLDTLAAISPRQIVCAVHIGQDLLSDAATNRLLDVALTIAQGFGAAVTCVYVRESGPAEQMAAIKERLKNIRIQMQDVAEVETGSGSIREAILKVANRQKADLIMLGRTRLGTPGLGLQPHILKFDHDAPCPVLSVL